MVEVPLVKLVGREGNGGGCYNGVGRLVFGAVSLKEGVCW